MATKKVSNLIETELPDPFNRPNRSYSNSSCEKRIEKCKNFIPDETIISDRNHKCLNPLNK